VRLNDTVKYEHGGNPWVDDSDDDGLLDYYDIDLNNENDTQLFVRDAIAPVVETIKFKRHFNAGDEYIEMRVEVSDNAGIKLVQPILTDPIPVNNEWADDPATLLPNEEGWYVKNFDVGCKGYVRSLTDMAGFVFVKDINSNWNLSETRQQTLIGEWFEAALEWAVAAKEAVAEAAAAVVNALNYLKNSILKKVDAFFNSTILPVINSIKDMMKTLYNAFISGVENITEYHDEASGRGSQPKVNEESLFGAGGGKVFLEFFEEFIKMFVTFIFVALFVMSILIVAWANVVYILAAPLGVSIIAALFGLILSFDLIELIGMASESETLDIDYEDPDWGDKCYISIYDLFISKTDEEEDYDREWMKAAGLGCFSLLTLSIGSGIGMGAASVPESLIISFTDSTGVIANTFAFTMGLLGCLWYVGVIMLSIGTEYENMAKFWGFIISSLGLIFSAIALIKFPPANKLLGSIALSLNILAFGASIIY